MWEFLNAVWRFEYAVVPCLLAYITFDIPIIYRRLTRRIYVPIYFALFPYGYSDELYARYFDEDSYYMAGGPFREGEIKNARTKIIWVSVLSLALTMSISPFMAALFSFYFLDDVQQVQFFYTLAIVKASLLLWALYDLRWVYRVTDVVPIGYIAVVYGLYWIAILKFYGTALTWITAKHVTGGLPAIASGLLDFVIFDIGVEILFVAIIGFLIPWRLTSGTANPVRDHQSDND